MYKIKITDMEREIFEKEYDLSFTPEEHQDASENDQIRTAIETFIHAKRPDIEAKEWSVKAYDVEGNEVHAFEYSHIAH